MVCVVLFVWFFVCVCDAIMRVEMIHLISIYLIRRFLSRFGRLVVGHEGMGKSEVSVFCSVSIDECPVDNFVGYRCGFVEQA